MTTNQIKSVGSQTIRNGQELCWTITDLESSNWGPMHFKQKILLQVCNETAVEQKFVGVDGRMHSEVDRSLCVSLDKAAGEEDGGLQMEISEINNFFFFLKVFTFL